MLVRTLVYLTSYKISRSLLLSPPPNTIIATPRVSTSRQEEKTQSTRSCNCRKTCTFRINIVKTETIKFEHDQIACDSSSQDFAYER